MLLFLDTLKLLAMIWYLMVVMKMLQKSLKQKGENTQITTEQKKKQKAKTTEVNLGLEEIDMVVVKGKGNQMKRKGEGTEGQVTVAVKRKEGKREGEKNRREM